MHTHHKWHFRHSTSCSGIRFFRKSHQNMKKRFGAINRFATIFPNASVFYFLLIFFTLLHRHPLAAAANRIIIRWYLSVTLSWRRTLHSLSLPLPFMFSCYEYRHLVPAFCTTWYYGNRNQAYQGDFASPILLSMDGTSLPVHASFTLLCLTLKQSEPRIIIYP